MGRKEPNYPPGNAVKPSPPPCPPRCDLDIEYLMDRALAAKKQLEEVILAYRTYLSERDMANRAEAHGSSWSHGVEAIARERDRQLLEEGYDEEHDRDHCQCEIAQAAIAYLLSYAGHGDAAIAWPWNVDSFKPSAGGIRDLEKAGALIAAEIDRVVRCGHG